MPDFYGSPHIAPDSAGFRSVPLSQAALARSPAGSPILTRRRVQWGTAWIRALTGRGEEGGGRRILAGPRRAERLPAALVLRERDRLASL